MEDEWDIDRCYECSGYGDDYSFDENGELVSNCIDCPFNPYRQQEYQDAKSNPSL